MKKGFRELTWSLYCALGYLTRFKLSEFHPDYVQVLDLTKVNENLKGFADGFIEGNYAYLVTYANFCL